MGACKSCIAWADRTILGERPVRRAPAASNRERYAVANSAPPQASEMEFEQCSTKPWYWVPCSKEEAEEAVLGVSSGGFVVRNSSKAGTHVLVVNDNGCVVNNLIRRDESRKFVFGGRQFNSIDAVINSLKKGATGGRPLISKSTGLPLYLLAGRQATTEEINKSVATDA